MSEKSRGSECDASVLAARWRWQRGPVSFGPRGRCGPRAASLGWRTWYRTPTLTTSLATVVGVVSDVSSHSLRTAPLLGAGVLRFGETIGQSTGETRAARRIVTRLLYAPGHISTRRSFLITIIYLWSSTLMVLCADYAALLTNHPTIQEALRDHASELGHDFTPYRHHVYRVLNLCVAIVADSRFELEKLPLAP